MHLQIGTSLNEFILENEKKVSGSSGELSKLLRQIALASKLINYQVNRAGLGDILGSLEKHNVQGEEVQKMDEIANEQFIAHMRQTDCCAGVASEELDEIISFDDLNEGHKYVVHFDPLDGSSNIDVNVSIGTIFSIYKRLSITGPVTMNDFLQKGKNQIAAGYVIYGSSTMLVYTSGNGVHGFTLDPELGEFCLSHPNIKTPDNGKIYSINQGSVESFSKGVKDYLNYCVQSDSTSHRPYSLRYIGSMVADFHRNMLKGGIFIYPATAKDKKGKLRLMYECNPMSFIIEQAGGISSNGLTSILEIVPTDLHERTPIFIGSKNMVEKALEFLKEDLNA